MHRGQPECEAAILHTGEQCRRQRAMLLLLCTGEGGAEESTHGG